MKITSQTLSLKLKNSLVSDLESAQALYNDNPGHSLGNVSFPYYKKLSS